MRDIIKEFNEVHGDYFTYSDFIYKNNKQYIDIKCKNGHEYSTQVLTHLRSKGCPYCRGTKRYHSDVISELVEVHNGFYDYSKSFWNNMEDKIIIICPIHGDFLQSVKVHLNGHKCQKCSNRFIRSSCEFVNSLKDKFKNVDFSKTLFKNTKTAMYANCKKHGEIKFYPNFKNHVCSKCYQIEKNSSNFKKRAIEKYGNRFEYISEYEGNIKHMLILDKKSNTIFRQTPQAHLKGEPHDIYWSHRNNTENFISESIKVHGNIYSYEKSHYKGSKTNIEIICKEHGSFLQTPNNHLRGTGCPSCNRFNIKQNDVSKFIQDIGFMTIDNDRSLLNGMEIDIYIPELKIGFEFNGLYWHSDIYRDSLYHLDKTIKCNLNGVKLIHIWEDDWDLKKDIVKSIISNRLNKVNNKIYARNCELVEIHDNKLVKDFLNKNHIQGFIGSKVKLGLFFNNELVSIMTFGNLRKSLGQKNIKNHYEMLRFCNKLNTVVIGGASKLFKYFIKNYNVNSVLSYSDSSRYDGGIYERLGFNLLSNTKPNYYWVIDDVRKHRFNFRKDKLVRDGFDPNKTEIEIMRGRGYYRIWDCGSKKWVFNNQS